ncbi:hypothetical protein ABIB85_000498 [Bradyrhizobium sp. JR1.5]
MTRNEATTSHPVVHHASVPEFAQAGVDDGIAGAATLPGCERLGVGLPWEAIEVCLQVFGGKVGMVVQQVPAELTPAKLAQELVDAGTDRGVFRRGEPRGVPHLARAELAEPQMR